MDKEAWWATAHRVSRVRHDLATKPPPPPHHEMQQDLRKFSWGWSTKVGRHISMGGSTWPWSSYLSKDFRGSMVAGLCLKQNHCLPYKTVTHNAPHEDSAIYWLKCLLIKSSTEFPLKIFRGKSWKHSLTHTHTHTHTHTLLVSMWKLNTILYYCNMKTASLKLKKKKRIIEVSKLLLLEQAQI